MTTSPLGSSAESASGEPLHHPPFPITKFRPPRLRADLLPRHGLVARLAAAIEEHPLTLIVAGAGYGKTLLAAMALQRVDHLPLWINVDREDDDPPERFLAALIACIENALPGTGAAAETAFARSSDPAQAWLAILGLLINGVAERPEKIVLVIDAVDAAGAWIYKLLGYLIERLPPNLHIVLITRDEPPLPLSRGRAARAVADLCQDDLRFDAAEISEVTAAVLGARPPEHVVERIARRTDGWPACVTLLAGALVDAPDPDALLDRIEGRQRTAFEFLSTEVFERLREPAREFLLRVSILDELSPELCEPVSGRSDAFAILQELYAKGAFLTAIDVTGRVFRLNDLFRSLLREMLARTKSRDELRALHLLAGHAESVPERAVAHFIRAEAWDAAAEAIDTCSQAMLRLGSTSLLARWIEALPAEVLQRRPRLVQLLGSLAWLRGELSTATSLLTRAAAGLAAVHDHAARGESLILLSHALTSSCDLEGAAAAMREAMQCGIATRHRARLLMQNFWRDMTDRRPGLGIPYLDEALDLAQTERSAEALRIVSEFLPCQVLGIPGATLRIERFLILTDEWATAAPGLMTSSIRLRAWLKLWRGEISEALSLAHDAERRTAETGECRWTPFESPLLQLIGSSISGDVVATERAMARLARQMGRPDSDLGASRNPWLMVSQLGEVEPNGVVNAWRSGYRMPGARANLVLGRDAAAAEIAASIATDKFLSFDCAVADVARPFARGMAAALRQRWAEAAHEYHEALHAQERLPLTAFFGDARIHLACVTLALGDTAAARDLMMAVVQHVQMEHAPAVLLWEPRSMILPLVRLLPRQSPQHEFAQAVLATHDKRPVHGAETHPGILTVRELDVLQSLATGVPNAAVAVKLGISVHTVKRHVANILAKLDVGTRGEAVAVARKRGLAD